MRATATGKYSHMQKSPNQVHTCTHASWRIVAGMLRMASLISATPPPIPTLLAFIAWNAAMSSGGYSFVVRIVHSTAPRNAAAPT